MKFQRYFWTMVTVLVIPAAFMAPQTRVTTPEQVKSPLVGISAEQENYPQGSQRRRAQYEKPDVEVRLKAVDLTSTATVATGTAAVIQSQLPAGLALQRGTATHIEMEVPTARLTGKAAKAAAVGPRQTVEKWLIGYPLEYKGVPVAKFSSVLAVVGGDGRLLYMRKRNLPTEVDASEPTVDQNEAVQLGRQQAKEVFGEAALEVSKASLEIWVSPEQKGRLAWTFTITTDSVVSPRARRYWVSAVNKPKILYLENLVYHQHKGTVTGMLWKTTPLKPTVNRPLGHLEVTRMGSGGGAQTTAEDGQYSFPGTGNVTIQAALKGDFSVVDNQAGSEMARSATGNHTNPIDLNFNAAVEFELAQTTGFYWINVAREFAKTILVSPELDKLLTLVNINDACNAYWYLPTKTINFFRAGTVDGTNCPNTAYSDIVVHEYGHGVDDWKGGILDGGYSEGFGDAMALLITRQSCVGRDIFGAGTCLRRATDVNMWPPGPTEGVHAQGKRYAQFTWQLVQELKNSFSEDDAYLTAKHLILAAAAGNPSDIPDAVMLSFLADDDDGDLSNGTPHCVELAAAADSRNIPRPSCPGVSNCSTIILQPPSGDGGQVLIYWGLLLLPALLGASLASTALWKRKAALA